MLRGHEFYGHEDFSETCTNSHRQAASSVSSEQEQTYLSWAHALLKGFIITDSQKNTRDNSKEENSIIQGRNPIVQVPIFMGFPPRIMSFYGDFLPLFMGFTSLNYGIFFLGIMGSP